MQKSNRDLAIFAALPVLEAAVRQKSFTRAAREFGLTQSAFSRRIQALEKDLGIILFARRGRAIKITDEGARLAEAARAALDLIEAARHDLGQDTSGTVRIGILPSLGSCWLAPRLSQFCEVFPSLSVRVEAIDADFRENHKDPVTWDPSVLDVVITRGHGGWRSLNVTKLSAERMVPVRRRGTSTTQKVGHSSRSGAWKTYSDKAPKSVDFSGPSIVFEHFNMIIEAVRAGAGVALLPDILVSQDLSDGLLEACGPPQCTGAGYFVVTSDRSAQRASCIALVEWLQGQVNDA